MIPQVSSFCLVRRRDDIQIANSDEVAQAAGTFPAGNVYHPVAVRAEVKQDVKTTPSSAPTLLVSLLDSSKENTGNIYNRKIPATITFF